MLTSSIAAYYQRDHDRLDDLFHQYRQNREKDFASAKQFFIQFKRGLERHIAWEEQILFPAFEEKTGMTQGGPTAVMRLEHVKIKQGLEELHAEIKTGGAAVSKTEENLWSHLQSHNHKEEKVLYPMLDQLLSDEERERIFLKMGSLPEDMGHSCCCGLS